MVGPHHRRTETPTGKHCAPIPCCDRGVRSIRVLRRCVIVEGRSAVVTRWWPHGTGVSANGKSAWVFELTFSFTTLSVPARSTATPSGFFSPVNGRTSESRIPPPTSQLPLGGTLCKILLKAAIPGIVTGLLVAVALAIGGTALMAVHGGLVDFGPNRKAHRLTGRLPGLPTLDFLQPATKDRPRPILRCSVPADRPRAPDHPVRTVARGIRIAYCH